MSRAFWWQTHFVAQTGDPQGTGQGGESVWGLINGPQKRYFPKNEHNRCIHTGPDMLPVGMMLATLGLSTIVAVR